eukprot:TRINITY_DN2572_c0_g1_i1.p1 TRINITY_DN2572_c0_g1~~TRINITY_DN2572_c0_g1_i1.p1  ORF type:complete len:123 (+),score=9.43 TRINITY_DN2572_c0_g1_i1:65-433(+)
MNPQRAAVGGKMTGAPIAISGRNDGWVPSAADLSTSYGGTIYATTPGGTKIAYDRTALMYIRNSPLSKTPTTLPVIPGVTAPDEALPPRPVQFSPDSKDVSAQPSLRGNEEEDEDGGVFEMD